MSIGKTYTEKKAEEYQNKSKKIKRKRKYTKYSSNNQVKTNNNITNIKPNELSTLYLQSHLIVVGLFLIIIGIILFLIFSPISIFIILIGVLTIGYSSYEPKKKYKRRSTKSNKSYKPKKYNPENTPPQTYYKPGKKYTNKKAKSMRYYKKSRKHEDGKRWVKGLEGENIVLEKLNTLPKNYFVFHDVELPGGYGNIDHIVVGPTGLFVIETKNYSGKYRINGNQWFHYKNNQYSKMEKNPGKQLIINILQLKNFLEEANISKSKVYANGIVTLVQKNYSITRPPENYKVCSPPEIPDYILSRRETNNKKLLAKIAMELEPYCTELTYVPKS